MTGFGTAEGAFGSARVSVELRTVNHRFFNPSLKLPAAVSRWEPDVRELLRQRIARGHVSVSARIEWPEVEAALVDEARFGRYAKALRDLRDRHGLEGVVDVAAVLRMPDVVRNTNDEVEGTLDELMTVVVAATDALTSMRQDEGRRLVAILAERTGVIEAALVRLTAKAPTRMLAHRDRLRENVKLLTDGLAVDEQRIAQELALIADRLDVGEELDRFRTHISAFREALAREDGEPVGKKLGFLLQEMLREANTTGSKANDATMQQDVILIKEELERIREQVENLE